MVAKSFCTLSVVVPFDHNSVRFLMSIPSGEVLFTEFTNPYAEDENLWMEARKESLYHRMSRKIARKVSDALAHGD